MLEMPLGDLQRWMQTVIVHPGDVDEAVASPDAGAILPLDRLGDVILPSATLTATERVGIYHGMYMLRMYDALAFDYPGLEHFLGPDRFHDLVHAYVQAHPSRSYTLNRLGDHLPEFLQTASVPRRAFCHDLARLELAVTEAFDAAETSALSEAAIAAVAPDAWERARLRPVASFRLLALRYPVNDYLQSVRDEDHRHPAARAKNTWVAVYRRNYAVYRLDMSRVAHDLLADLASGMPLGQALGAALQRGGRPQPEPDVLFRWFREWMSGGVFQSVELD